MRFCLVVVLTAFLGLSEAASNTASLGLRSGTRSGLANVLLARNRAEPVVAADPRHLRRIVIASNTNYSEPLGDTYPDGYFTSRNSGRSFSFGTAPIIRPFTTEADPSLVFDSNGTLFFSYLSEAPAYCSSGSSAVVITHSTDGGVSFKAARIVDTNQADDKPNLAVESIPRGPSHIFLTWTRWHGSTSDIWYSRSLDGGVSFSLPRMLYSMRGDSYGSVPVVGPHGRVYVFWSVFPDLALTKTVPAEIVMRSSSDDGAHFGPLQVAERFTGIPQMTEPGSLRTLSQPAILADKRGTLYLAWAQVAHDYGGGRVDVDMEVSKSSTQGLHWNHAHRVNDSRRGDRFMPAMSILADGSLAIAFYDRRNGSAELDLYSAHISFAHGFRRSANIRLNSASSPVSDIDYIRPGSTCLAPGRFFGDYIGAAPCANDLCVVWADTQLHVAGETDLWFSKIPLPEVS